MNRSMYAFRASRNCRSSSYLLLPKDRLRHIFPFGLMGGHYPDISNSSDHSLSLTIDHLSAQLIATFLQRNRVSLIKLA